MSLLDDANEIAERKVISDGLNAFTLLGNAAAALHAGMLQDGMENDTAAGIVASWLVQCTANMEDGEG